MSTTRFTKQIRKALKKDIKALENATDQKLSRWLDKFDPHGEWGLPVFKKAVRKVLGLNFKTYTP